MNREEFLKELEYRLRRLPKEERTEALAFYWDYLDDAGPENEAAALETLGSPKTVARQIVQKAAVKAVSPKEGASEKRGFFSTLWLVILGICAAPVALPLAATAVLLLLAALLVVAAILISALALLVAAGISGVFSVVLGVPVLLSAPANGAVVVGFGLLLTGISVIVSLALAEGCNAGARGLLQLLGRLLHREKDAAGDKGGRFQ